MKHDQSTPETAQLWHPMETVPTTGTVIVRGADGIERQYRGGCIEGKGAGPVIPKEWRYMVAGDRSMKDEPTALETPSPQLAPQAAGGGGVMSDNWRPIETLPANTTAIVGRWCLHPGHRYWQQVMARWYVMPLPSGPEKEWSYRKRECDSPFYDDDGNYAEPTHWHEIPPPPAEPVAPQLAPFRAACARFVAQNTRTPEEAAKCLVRILGEQLTKESNDA